MKHRLCIVCVCVSAMLLTAPVAWGDILSDDHDKTESDPGVGDNFGASGGYIWSFAGTFCDGDSWSSYGGANGYQTLYTTEAGEFDWQHELDGTAQAGLELWDDATSYANAWVEVIAVAPAGQSEWDKDYLAHASLALSGDDGSEYLHTVYPCGSTGYDSGIQTSQVAAMDGVTCENWAVVYVSTHDGGEDEGWAFAFAYAEPSMWASW